MKRMFLCLGLVCVLIGPSTSRAQFTFTTNNGAITITGYSGVGGNVVIPGATNGYPVNNIGNQAFSGKTVITNVTIPGGITNIGNSAFASCANLTNVTIPDSVITLGDSAFYNCHSLTNIIIGNSVTHLGTNAFASCVKLASLNIPKGVTSIYMGDQGAFANCPGLTQFTVDAASQSFSSPDGVLFDKNQSALIAFPQGRGGTYAIPNTVTKIGDCAFDLCGSLIQVAIPNGVTVIGSQVFHSCSSFTSVTIPGSVTNIGQYAFSNNRNNLHQVYFQGNAPSVNGGSASGDSTLFAGDTGTAFYVPGTTGWGATIGGWPARAGIYQPQPQILGNGLVGPDNVFRFGFAWATNTSVVVESSTDLQNWVPVITLKLASGTNIFSDSTWASYAQQFYRVRSP
ncbi:MAG: leucine-rich repeat domain-containing protein [Verrucomicrobiae bacterium]|nr:leucine-rich repeat domain-containing protein [Verrucomicrobiae bacterium]